MAKDRRVNRCESDKGESPDKEGRRDRQGGWKERQSKCQDGIWALGCAVKEAE